MSLTVLSVAYPLAPVRADTPGGAEQILGLLDSELTALKHKSIVIACEGSQVEGELIETPSVNRPIDSEVRAHIREQHKFAINQALKKWDVDIIHMHGLDYDCYLPPHGVPVLATLHLPLAWYSQKALYPKRPETYLHCVSKSQRMTYPSGLKLLDDIENGVPIERLAANVSKRNFAISLGRICPEKGFHIAIEAARKAGVPMLLAGRVFNYETHENYFNKEIVPRLDEKCCRFIGPIGFERKRRLLSAAKCVLVPSLAPETSSLVAMEALACGTPVIAFPSGALTNIIEDGKTGFLVTNQAEMAVAIKFSEEIDPEACRQSARERFSSRVMVNNYLETYSRLIEGRDIEYLFS
ncbi:MAG: glycosyltransferase family 4 protein [Deltaproteobacteria bacterium]|nr:glycosyltransferase family 4 protein [Deltaproteobacteria bacterium]